MPSLSENRASVLAALQKIVAGREDHESECVYFESVPFHDPVEVAPVCIIGHLLYEENRVSFDALVEAVQVDGLDLNGTELEDVSLAVPISFIDGDSELERLLSELQYDQDNGKTWGEALARFQEKLEKLETENV